MHRDRRTAVITGALFLLTEVAAVAGLLLYRPLLDGHPGADTRALFGVLAEIVLVTAVVGTATTLHPVLSRHSPPAAHAYLAGRLLEAAVIAVGVLAALTLVTLPQEAPTRGLLTALHAQTFLLGPNVALGLNTTVLAYALHRARLLPRPITVLGLVGGPLILAFAVAVLFGAYQQVSTAGSLAALPVLGWELALAVRLLTRGFAPPQPMSSGSTRIFTESGGRSATRAI
ncbi:DUF4386 domain-containing protein [Kitasatospora sp. NPDC051853]|uniref:DUF4386 domain-containing protein n=1 Tax=Kitasatospora sp. NPDC051853 TaxID=3364058 RepID=UPI00378B28AF